jgi:hypothetical protein
MDSLLVPYAGLPAFDQFLHQLHFALAALASAIALLPITTAKGGTMHRLGGFLYLPVAGLVMFLGLFMAMREANILLFSFSGFIAYLVLTGFLATHNKGKAQNSDWLCPTLLLFVVAGIILHLPHVQMDWRGIALSLFAIHLFGMAIKEAFTLFYLDIRLWRQQWMTRHVTGMAGSWIACLSIVALTLIPYQYHWVWSATLLAMAAMAAVAQPRKRTIETSDPVLYRALHTKPVDDRKIISLQSRLAGNDRGRYKKAA